MLRRRRKLRVETLESRRLLAAYINELHYAPLFGDTGVDQYLELRGEPGETVPAGTYFLGVESADGVDDLGSVHTIFDLSGKQFGATGLMVFAQAGNGYQIAAEATTFVGNDGFKGIPGFSADRDANSIHGGSSSYFLVQTDVLPDLTMDIDTDNDGLADAAIFDWNVLDGVSVFDWVESTFPQHAYAPILFTEDNVGNSLASIVRVPTEDLAYVGRIGDSTGYDPAGWVVGNTVETDRDAGNFEFQLQRGVFGTVLPPAYSGRTLDHIGQPNWYSEIAGNVFQDRDLDGGRSADEPGLAGVDVFLDSDMIGADGVHREAVNPDDFVLDTVVTNISSNVTLTSAGASNEHQSFDITIDDKVFGDASQGQQFAHSGVGFFNENRRLRLDFYRPAQKVAVNFLGASPLSDVYGRLEIFDAGGQSLGFLRTVALRGETAQQLLTLTSPGAHIAYAVAYSNDAYFDSSPFGRIDYLDFELPSYSTSTNSDGDYSFDRVPQGQYEITIDTPPGYTIDSPSTGMHQLTVDDEIWHSGKDFGLAGGLPPEFEGGMLSASEAHAVGTSLGGLNFDLGYPQQELDVEFLAGNDAGIFQVDLTNKQLRLIGDGLNFEDTVSHAVVIKLADQFDSSLSATATITVAVTDANDAPVVEPFGTTIAENPEAGAEIGTLVATDEDSGENGQFSFSLHEHNLGAFAIDPDSGLLTVADSDQVNFEAQSSIVLSVRATDKQNSSIFGQRSVTIGVSDVNEPPEIPEQTVRASEAIAAGGSLGFVSHSDPDIGQTLTWSILQPEQPEFTVHSGGELRLLPEGRLNFEDVDSYVLVVQAADSGEPSLSAQQTITIQVTDANDPPQFDDQDGSASEAAAPGDLLATLTAEDEDAGQELTFEWVSGPESLFRINAAGQVFLQDEAALDFETLNVYQIVVRVTDSAPTPTSVEATLTINVQDANDPPSIIDAPINVGENSPADTLVATIGVQDQDSADTHTFSIVSQNADWFALGDEGKLIVNAGAAIDFEATPTGEVVVEVEDEGGATAQHTFAVTVEDRNDAPRVANDIADQEASVGEEFSFTVPADTFIDDDEGDSLRFRAVDGDGFSLPSWIEFDQETRMLVGTPAEGDVGEQQVRVSGIDNENAFTSTTFTIEVVGSQFAWNNRLNALDTNNDSLVTPVDALVIINYINAGSASAVPDTPPERGFLDVNADNFVTPSDVLIVINRLNAESDGEGEFAVRDAYFGDLRSFDSTTEDEEHLLELVLQNYKLSS